MGRFVNPDNSAFKGAYKDQIYVDKSGLIKYTNKVLETPSAFICNSRPRRFGKSMTANMLAAYYSKGADSREMFSSLEISSSPDFEKHLNKYDVIHLDIQECIEPSGGMENVVSYIKREVIKELEKFYPQIVTPNDNSIFDVLSKIFDKTGNQFVIIIDEWDVLIRDDANNQKVQDEYISFLRSIFKGVQASRYTALAYLTGILPIKREKTQSALNNFNEYTMINPGPLAEYVGFTEEEVKGLAEKYHVDFEETKRWYDGYLLKGIHVYNPKAVVSVMLNGEFISYWSDTSSYKVIVPLINMNYDGLKEAILEMLSGGKVPVDISDFQNDVVSFASEDDVLTYLIHLGYLAYDQKKKTAFIPNEEIREEMNSAVKKKTWSESIAFMERSLAILDATLNKDSDKVAQGIEKIHDNYSSALKYNDENSLSNVLTLAYLASMDTYFKPIRELPAGRGFADFVYIPKPEFKEDYPAIVVELKWNKDAKTALDQIKEKNYPDSIKDYTDNILLVGINYDKTTKQHECLIEKL